jgi:hypothetical protein
MGAIVAERKQIVFRVVGTKFVCSSQCLLKCCQGFLVERNGARPRVVLRRLYWDVYAWRIGLKLQIAQAKAAKLDTARCGVAGDGEDDVGQLQIGIVFERLEESDLFIRGEYPRQLRFRDRERMISVMNRAPQMGLLQESRQHCQFMIDRARGRSLAANELVMLKVPDVELRQGKLAVENLQQRLQLTLATLDGLRFSTFALAFDEHCSGFAQGAGGRRDRLCREF